ncbi:MAG: hypothetical protein AAF959_23070, partial [Cyanobacteria bacterium P01_D01_bin.56]
TQLYYMHFWSLLIMVVLGLIRLRSLLQFCIMGIVSIGLLFMTWTLSLQLSEVLNISITAFSPITHPTLYFSDVAGWLILVIFPVGWLAPLIGVLVAQRWGPQREVVYAA